MSYRTVSAELQKKAEDELNENSDRIPEAIEHIRKWISQQPHLSTITIDDQWLLAYLRGCKFSLQRTKEKLELNYILRAILPELYRNRDPHSPEIQEVLRVGASGLVFPSTKGSVNPCVALIRLNKIDPSVHSLTLILKVSMMVIEIMLAEDDTYVIGGQILVLDMTGTTMNHLIQLTPTFAKTVVKCLLLAYPLRPKSIYFINSPKIFVNVYRALKHLLTEKITKRVRFLQEIKDLSALISSEVLSKDYGGDALSCNELTDFWKTKVKSYRDWFLNEEKYFSNENLRPGKCSIVEDIFGVEGSFRKLEID